MGRTLARRGEIVEGHDHAHGALDRACSSPAASGMVPPAVTSLAITGVGDARSAAITESGEGFIRMPRGFTDPSTKSGATPHASRRARRCPRLRVSSAAPIRRRTKRTTRVRRFFHRIVEKYVLRDFSPITLFLFMGLASLAFGIVFGGYLWTRGYETGLPTPTGSITLCLLALVVGFPLCLQAIVLDIQATPR